jgi:hypothetical protein
MGEMIKSYDNYFEGIIDVPAGETVDITPLKGDVMRIEVLEGFGEILINDGTRGFGPGDIIDQIVDVTCFVRADPGSTVVLERTYS